MSSFSLSFRTGKEGCPQAVRWSRLPAPTSFVYQKEKEKRNGKVISVSLFCVRIRYSGYCHCEAGKARCGNPFSFMNERAKKDELSIPPAALQCSFSLREKRKMLPTAWVLIRGVFPEGWIFLCANPSSPSGEDT